MLWSKRSCLSLAIAVLCLALAGCGFKPLHGRGAQAISAADLDSVQIPILRDREGQLLTNFLSQAFNPDGRRAVTNYHLEISLSSSKQDLGVRRDATATRTNLSYTANLVLREAVTNKQVFKGRSVTVVSYNILDARFATLAAEQDAIRRGTKALADNIKIRIAAFLASRKKKS
ncbi:MAG: LPS-assembly lipoprotein [Alphaproteobacteria bacterium]|jgi:LPS-assembly lipoprotein